MAFTLESPAFIQNGAIPVIHTCEGGDASPPLKWSGAPAGTKTFALIVDDPDAPDPAAPKMTWVHWVLYNIPATTDALPQNAAKGLPAGSAAGANDWKRNDYGGPCPPIGSHRYYHKLYALDTKLTTPIANKAALEAAMKGHVLGEAVLVGTYKKKNS